MRCHVYGSPGPETTIGQFETSCTFQDGAELEVTAHAGRGTPTTVQVVARFSHLPDRSDLVPTLFSACSGGGPARCRDEARTTAEKGVGVATATYEVADPAAEFTIGVRIPARRNGAPGQNPAASSTVYFCGSPSGPAPGPDGVSRGTRTRRGRARSR